jgi:hypothetical protein
MMLADELGNIWSGASVAWIEALSMAGWCWLMNCKVSGRERLWPEMRHSFRLLEVTKETYEEPQSSQPGYLVRDSIRTPSNTSVECFCSATCSVLWQLLMEHDVMILFAPCYADTALQKGRSKCMDCFIRHLPGGKSLWWNLMFRWPCIIV